MAIIFNAMNVLCACVVMCSIERNVCFWLCEWVRKTKSKRLIEMQNSKHLKPQVNRILILVSRHVFICAEPVCSLNQNYD